MKAKIVLIILGVTTFALVHLDGQGSVTIYGSVTDSTGAVLPGVSIALPNTETDVERTTLSEQDRALRAVRDTAAPVARELMLIEGSGLLQRVGSVGWGALLLEMSQALRKREALGQLDKANQIAALSAAVAVEEILPGVDIERRPGFRVQGTESDELGALTCRPAGPVQLPQIIEQQQALLQFFEILAHGAVSPSETSVGEGRRHSQARMVGKGKFSQRRRGQRTCKTGVSQDKASGFA